MKHRARFSIFLLALGVLLSSGAASGAVKLEGDWPEVDKPISLDASGLPRSEAVRRIADAAGWNVVWSSPSTEPVDIHVKKQPASKVLELVLSDADYTARRDGTLIHIERTKTAVQPAPAPVQLAPLPGPSAAPPSAPPAGADAGEADDDDHDPDPKPLRHKGHKSDRTVFGGTVTIAKDETAKDVSVFGGTAEVYGTVNGDMSLLGGAGHVYPGARITGDVDLLGGSLKLDDGCTVDGDVNVLGGALDKAPGAKIGGDVSNNGGHGSGHGHGHGHGDADAHEERLSKIHRAGRFFGGAMARTAMLFVFGAVLLALATRRMGFLEGEVAERPMRSFALGVVGSIALVVLFVLLCVTLIGIPVAVVGLLVTIFGAYAGVCAVLTAVGRGLLRRWTDNPYLHLAAGCAIFLVIGLIPYAGGFVTAILIFTGIGTLVATRAAGYIPPRGGRGFSAGAPQPTADAV